MDQFLINTISNAPSALAVIAFLLWQDYKEKRNGQAGSDTNQQMCEEVHYLKTHYNDELSDTLIRMEGKQDRQFEVVNKISNKQDEIIKYGVPVLKK